MTILNPTQICDGYMEASIKKGTSPVWKLLLLGFIAGVFIGLGAAGSSAAAHAIENVGLAKLVTGLVFPVGLCMIVLLGAELFTGNVLMINGALGKKIKWTQVARNWVLVYFGNFAGALAVAFLMVNFGQLDMGSGALATYTAKVAAGKSSLPWENAFVLGIFCNVLVCAAVYMGTSGKDTFGKVIGLCLPVTLFVTAGFEHCIANMYYIPAGIMAATDPSYAAAITAAGIDISVLNIGTFITANLIPVTLGNIVGGMAVGLYMYFGHATKLKEVKGAVVETK